MQTKVRVRVVKLTSLFWPQSLAFLCEYADKLESALLFWIAFYH